jgi:hypothetical protein
MAGEPLLERDVLPILTKNCMGCHGGLRQQGGLDLRTVPAMLEGGHSGPAIRPGDADNSVLWARIAAEEMPEGENREKLSPEDKAVIKGWIDAGLPTLSQRQQNVDPLLPAGTKHDPLEVAAAIDRHIDGFLAAARLQPVPRSADDEFLRRVYLDLTGRVPTAAQATAFLDSREPDKRAELIDALLATPEFGEQFGRTWRDWICPPELPSDMNGGKQPHQEARRFGQWLGEKFARGESWDRIVRDILTVEGEIKDQPQVIFFGLVGQDGKVQPDGSARAVASLFMGVQLQCAQCHDDPYRTWAQTDYWGLAAFFGRTQGDFKKIESGRGPSKTPGEVVIPESAFVNSGSTVKAAFPGGEPFAATGDDLRRELADWLTARDNPYFARSFANRLWFNLFSRGIVHPVDDFRELNPPSHPGLMQLLANEFAASGFDVKHLVRCVCNSQAYQRTSRVAEGVDEQTAESLAAAYGRMPLRVMSADMLYDSLKLAYGDEKLDLRAGTGSHNTSGESAAVGDPYLEFQRTFGTNEEDATDFTHGIAQMLAMINHPRLLQGSRALDEYLKQTPGTTPGATPEQTVEWLYLGTLSRRPTGQETAEAAAYVAQAGDLKTAYVGVLWMLVNRSEYLLIR